MEVPKTEMNLFYLFKNTSIENKFKLRIHGQDIKNPI